ncbi:hypothetical protein ACH4D5_13170 [Streptomyces sp. NPDC018029]|uniref:hypothetical protein n=1 Tax=Streptomyces sp. NPDC018029 TaxID=3365032 RepID=UPI0037A81460
MSESAVQKALAVSERALSGIDEELARHAAGRGSVSNPGQLAALRAQLLQVVQQLAAPPLPPKDQRLRGIGRVIADSWPYDNPLGGMILEAERLYLDA